MTHYVVVCERGLEDARNVGCVVGDDGVEGECHCLEAGGWRVCDWEGVGGKNVWWMGWWDYEYMLARLW